LGVYREIEFCKEMRKLKVQAIEVIAIVFLVPGDEVFSA
jgi:hypothetical protein